MRFDVAIVGAGAAGLAAASKLCENGRSAVVLEARDRIGGRIHTLEDPRCAAPIELGAEFIHGTPHSTLALLREAGATGIGESGSSWGWDGTRLQQREDAFEAAADLIDRVDPHGADQSVDEFLKPFASQPQYAGAARWVRTLVEGFDAADPADASVQAIAQEWSGDASLQTTQLRPSRGYRHLMNSLAAALAPERVRVLLESTVREIRWGDDGVTFTGERIGAPFEIRARAAIVTVPLGVLQRDGLVFEPPLPQEKRSAIDLLAMGPVIKVALQFATPFWREVHDGRFADMAFAFGADATAFPTYWSTFPVISPLLMGWAGGPRAARFDGSSKEQIVACAVDDLALLFSVPRETLAQQLEAFHVHDWQHDPFAYGAYSYVRTGGMTARETLAQPLGSALFFAGEATAPGGEAGTVAGALESGTSAARLALQALAR